MRRKQSLNAGASWRKPCFQQTAGKQPMKLKGKSGSPRLQSWRGRHYFLVVNRKA